MAEFDRAALRKIFEGAEIEVPKDVLGQICDLHTSSMDGLPETIKELKGKLKVAEQERDAAKAKVPVDGEETISKAEYDKLKGEFDKYKTDVQEKETHNKKVEAYKAILKDANLSEKGIEKAVKYADWDKIELGEDGKLKGANDHIKAVRDEWAEYVTTTTTTGAKTSTPPVNNGGAKLTKAEIYARDDHGRYKLSTAERQKALAENPELLN